MRRYFLTCPLWQPTEPPPPLHEQVSPAGYPIEWQPAHCTFAMLGEPDTIFVDGSRSNESPAWIARNYRCTTHNRRPTIHQRQWNADRLRRHLMTDSGRVEQVRFATPYAIYRHPTDRDLPEDWPHAITPHRHYISMWITNRPPPRTLHSAW